MPPEDKPSHRKRRAAALALLAIALLAIALLAAPAPAADVDALQGRVDAARAEAGALAAELEAGQAQLFVAQQQAAAALAQEQQLTALLAVGERRAAELATAVSRSQRRLAFEKRRLGRARAVLAKRLVAIYKTGSPDIADLVLGAEDFDDLVTSADYVRSIEEADTRLAQRVEQVRNGVRRQLAAVEEAKARADAYNARLVTARAEISAVRQTAAAEAAQLQAVAASRASAMATLRASMNGWVDDIQAARAAAARAASEQAAQQQIELWLGGPYSIPSYIVMCESGGNYGAINPSSGAGGAYQILPSTWDLYGGEGAPHEASKNEQDEIAAQIWADSGPGAWVCAG